MTETSDQATAGCWQHRNYEETVSQRTERCSERHSGNVRKKGRWKYLVNRKGLIPTTNGKKKNRASTFNVRNKI
jgi:hypothetical protein